MSWKIVAIIFIILFTLETSLIFWGINEYNDQTRKESICAYDVCDLGVTHDQYYFDTTEDRCFCYKNNEVVLNEIVK